MRKRDVLVVAIACSLPVVGLVAPATAAEKVEVTTSKAGWYAQAPPCASVDCSVLPLVHPYPEDTLHVAISAGHETARTYLAFPVPLPSDGRLIGGTLELPLEVDPASGSASPETADFVACLTTPKFEPARGSFAKPPKIDCDIRRSALYREKDQIFTIDLERFAAEWTNGEAAVALVPSPRAVERGDTWHAVFPAGEEEPAEGEQDRPAPEITATLQYVSGSSAPPGAPTVDFTTETPVSASGGGAPAAAPPSFDDGTGFTSAQPSTEVPQVTTPTEAVQDSTEPVAAFVQGFAGPGFAYPIVWAFPLVLLVGLIAVGRALTKDLYRRGL